MAAGSPGPELQQRIWWLSIVTDEHGDCGHEAIWGGRDQGKTKNAGGKHEGMFVI